MARIPRILITGDPTVYHIISRTALQGFPLEDIEKDFLVEQMKHASQLWFVDIMGFCCMGNHFHLLVRMLPDTDFSDADMLKRLAAYYGEDRVFGADQLPTYRQKLSSLSEFVGEIKVRFARFYNKRHGRRGYFWGDRFKSVVVENGETLVNCLAYIDLNPVRAGLVQRPEDYRWNSIGYHIQTGNKDNFLSLDFGLRQFGEISDEERLRRYRQFLYETGAIDKGKGAVLDAAVVQKERNKDYRVTRLDRFTHRTRHFTDSAIIGSKAFVQNTYQKVKGSFRTKKDKIPKPVAGLAGVYSLRRLAEAE
jgi:REP element-mobilizing transposase RayT